MRLHHDILIVFGLVSNMFMSGASRMIILEPDWNPATDKQAAGRIYREGQTRTVHIYRMITANTLEESILSRQMHKVFC